MHVFVSLSLALSSHTLTCTHTHTHTHTHTQVDRPRQQEQQQQQQRILTADVVVSRAAAQQRTMLRKWQVRDEVCGCSTQLLHGAGRGNEFYEQLQ